jgi:hypothetical protein
MAKPPMSGRAPCRLRQRNLILDRRLTWQSRWSRRFPLAPCRRIGPTSGGPYQACLLAGGIGVVEPYVRPAVRAPRRKEDMA